MKPPIAWLTCLYNLLCLSSPSLYELCWAAWPVLLQRGKGHFPFPRAVVSIMFLGHSDATLMGVIWEYNAMRLCRLLLPLLKGLKVKQVFDLVLCASRLWINVDESWRNKMLKNTVTDLYVVCTRRHSGEKWDEKKIKLHFGKYLVLERIWLCKGKVMRFPWSGTFKCSH